MRRVVRRSLPRHGLIVLGLALGVLLLASWGAFLARASHTFPDVADDAFYHDFVDFLVENGITAGCGGGNYCGEDAVTRGQMAVFLKRLFDVTAARATFFNRADDFFVLTATDTAIATLTMTTPAPCILLMNGTLDWDDNGAGGALLGRWVVDGTQVGGTFVDQDESFGPAQSNESFAVVAGTVAAGGTHTIEWIARHSDGNADIEDIGAYVLCLPLDGDGNPAGMSSLPALAAGPLGSSAGVVDPAQ